MHAQALRLLTISSGKDDTTKGVHTGPGAMQFTRMPLEIRWEDKPFVKVTMAPCTPAFTIISSFEKASGSDICARTNAVRANAS